MCLVRTGWWDVRIEGEVLDGRRKNASFKRKTGDTSIYSVVLGAAGGGTGSLAEMGLLVLAEDVRLSL